ncbi:cysteine hydrolase [Micromonospora tulbaghiae]|uniref:Cysteine hydrolase n=1 Tax=Micromonospora tulbaghiae TaxID=479978 RepID=A0A386WGT3_9ACTN|nr:cysteine hydrolase [Micromonospora tulbaghiae]AYF26878.1 cysteine hydrolase [Micromonospora tulbaghiae]NED55531.1 cysteine hydrolase [Micromonospora aurantiaca]
MRDTEFGRAAVLSIHWQYEVVDPDGIFGPFYAEQVARHHVLPNARLVNEAVRVAGGLVIYTRVAYRHDYLDLIPNTPAFQMIRDQEAFLEGAPNSRIVDEIAPQVSDLVITHTRLTGFFGTDLDTILRGAHIDTVLLTGVATNLSVLGTAFEAINYGYRTITISDGCAAESDQTHLVSLETLGRLGRLATTREIVDRLRPSNADA